VRIVNRSWIIGCLSLINLGLITTSYYFLFLFGMLYFAILVPIGLFLSVIFLLRGAIYSFKEQTSKNPRFLGEHLGQLLNFFYGVIIIIIVIPIGMFISNEMNEKLGEPLYFYGWISLSLWILSGCLGFFGVAICPTDKSEVSEILSKRDKKARRFLLLLLFIVKVLTIIGIIVLYYMFEPELNYDEFPIYIFQWLIYIIPYLCGFFGAFWIFNKMKKWIKKRYGPKPELVANNFNP